MSERKEFFEKLYEHTTQGCIEIRTLPNKKQEFFDLREIDKVVAYCEQAKSDQNVYFGVGTRKKGCGSKDGIIEIPALWVDVDFKDTPLNTLKKRLKEFPFKPSIIVNSGGGWHLYWLLKEPESENLLNLEGYLKGLAHKFSGDRKSAEIARVLRPPQTLNHKYDPPRKTQMIELNNLRYNLMDFDDFYIDIPSHTKQKISIETDQAGLENVQECDFMKWCKANAKTLSEPLWYAMISNLAPFEGGYEAIHMFSKDYPKYSREETDRKIEHALKDTKPHTCDYIRDGYKCTRSCSVKSPAGLAKSKLNAEKKQGKKNESEIIETSFLTLEDGRIAEQIYNQALDPAHQFVTRTDDGFQHSPQIKIGNTIFIPAGIELVNKRVVLLPSEPIDYGSDAALSNEIQQFIHRYLDIPPFHEKLSVLYAKYSWIHDQFSVTSYLRARGEYGSGKSRLLQTVGSLAYKPMFCGGSTTSSPIFRIIELFKGTLVLDEADFKNSDLHMDIIKILNQGYMKGMHVLRTENAGKKLVVTSYDVYGCEIIATRKKYQDQALESRMLTVEMESTSRNDIPLIITDDFWQEAQVIRNKLLYWRFMKYGKTQLTLQHRIDGIENRLNQIILPILSITDDQSLIADIKQSIKEYQDEMIQDRGMDVEASILEALLQLRDRKEQERTMKLITLKANIIIGFSDKDNNALVSRKTGKIIKDSLKLKTKRGKDGYYVIWDEAIIAKMKERYGLDGEPTQDAGEHSEHDEHNSRGV